MQISVLHKRYDPISGKVVPVFFYYAIPSVIGVLSMSCAVIIDGIFIGKYGGAEALAAVNLTAPVFGLLFGIAMMLSVGGAAQCGKDLGAGKRGSADEIFSQTVVLVIGIALVATLLGAVFADQLVLLLGANEILARPAAEYLAIQMLFVIYQMGLVCLACFLRIEGRPYFAATAIVAGSVLNVVFDWVLIVEWHMGCRGAAWGTGFSELATFALLAVPYMARKSKLHFKWPGRKMFRVFKVARNGFSEFLNEISASIMLLVFNWLIIVQFGENGVAAFSIINYIVLCAILVSCGVGESLLPVVSRNLGALNSQRIASFLLTAALLVLMLGLLTSSLLAFSPEAIITFFIAAGEQETINRTTQFISRIWPVFLLSGLNIILSSYLTAMQRAFSSSVIALARGLLFPLLFLVFIRFLTSYEGVLIVLPLSEITTFFVALILLQKNTPAKLIRRRVNRLRRRRMATAPVTAKNENLLKGLAST